MAARYDIGQVGWARHRSITRWNYYISIPPFRLDASTLNSIMFIVTVSTVTFYSSYYRIKPKRNVMAQTMPPQLPPEVAQRPAGLDSVFSTAGTDAERYEATFTGAGEIFVKQIPPGHRGVEHGALSDSIKITDD